MIQEPSNLDELMEDDDDVIIRDAEEGQALEPLVTIDLDAVNVDAEHRSELITDSLSNYYFDEKYIKDHPYIPTKIMQEMDNVRRLYKMLMVNEKAQDALIKAISLNAGKGTLYLSLTSMQKSTLLIQKQLNDMVAGLETIFQRMQDEADKLYSEKEKEEAEDGSLTIRGAREFIKTIQAQMDRRKMKDGSIVDVKTGEIIQNPKVTEKTEEAAKILNDIKSEAKTTDAEPTVPEGATPISDILG